MTFIYRIICRLLLFFGFEDKSFELYKKHIMERRKNNIVTVRPEVISSYPATDLTNLRPTGHGERRVFRIPVGNIDEREIDEYVRRVADSFKRNVPLDPMTGQIDLKYNPLDIDEDIYLSSRSDLPSGKLFYMDVKYDDEKAKDR